MNLNKTQALKLKLRSRTPVFGAWTSLAHPQITEMFCNMGVDFIGIDIEHSTISLEQSQRIIAAAQAGGTTCLPRIASHSMEAIKRLLDSGADGIIAPMVNTPVEAATLGKYFQYPPQGARSYGIARAQNYGLAFEEYAKVWNHSGSLIVQIESLAGVENIDAILKNPAIDGAMIGPYDMSGTMGIPGQIEHPRVKEACQRVIEACKSAGVACGTQITEPSIEAVQGKLRDGFTFIILSSDIFLLWKWTSEMRKIVDAVR